MTALAKELPEPISGYEAVKRFIKSVDKGLLKVMSKMGISTYQSYCGAQIFDAVGLSRAFIDEFFFGTATSIEGAGLAEIAHETQRRHADAFGGSPVLMTSLEVGGEYAYRLRGETHDWTPETVSLLQHAVRGNARERYDAFAKILNEQSAQLLTIRGLFRVKTAEERRTDIRADRRGRGCRFGRQALFDRGNVVRFDLTRGAHHPRNRDESDRRQVQYR